MPEEMQALKVLLVDDSDLVAAMVSQALEAEGLEVIRGKNGAEGVELAYKEIPDVIIMDAEMPLMHGYLASRLLKNRRAICEIPIIMHTSLSEDKDKYWALSSGSNEFAQKDFDNLEHLVARVKELAQRPKPDLHIIQEDAKQLSRERVFELLGSLLDQQLFRSTINNLLAHISQTLDSLPDTCRQILNLLPRVCEPQISVLLLQYGSSPQAYILPSPELRQSNAEEFMSICLGDFYAHFPTLDLSKLETLYFNMDRCPDFASPGKGLKLQSYLCLPVLGRGAGIIGTLHVGNSSNNYFSEHLTSNIEHFVQNAGIILDNSILYTRMSEMQKGIRSAFSKFVPPEIIDQLIESSQMDVRLAGEKRDVCILFSDIRSFTSISENNSADSVVDFLNRYFDIMVALIKKHGGTIDKFIGDAILAIFGAPTSYEDNTQRAVLAAKDMISALPLLHTGTMKLPEQGFQIGIGIHRGNAIVGNIGSADKFDYTAIGDTVNLASRLEGLTKYYKQDIIISQEVKESLEADIAIRELDTVKVKGKDTPTHIYSVITKKNSYSDEFLSEFSKGLRMYRMANWSTAIEYFQKSQRLAPDDYASELLLERCKTYLEHPPEQWDGAQTMDSK